MLIQGQIQNAVPSSRSTGNPNAMQAPLGELAVTSLMPPYSFMAQSGRVFSATATVTAPVIYTTAAGTGGPLLWNRPNSGVNLHLLAVGFGVTTVSTVAAALGITGNVGQAVAPTTTTAIDASGSTLIGGSVSSANAYRVGTPSNAGNFFIPFSHLHTGALTVDNTGVQWIELNGIVVCPPSAWVSVAASATATTAVLQMSLIWAELAV